MKKALTKYSQILVLILVIIALAITYANYLSEMPLGVHNWAQSDRYAVAKTFENNTNFFAAQTYNITSEEGRCGVEFPLIQYISARISVLTPGVPLALIYKLINLSILLFGLWFFISQWKPATWYVRLIGFGLLFSPILVFYGAAFLPDTASLGLLFISLGLMIQFDRHFHFKSVFWIIFWAGLATLLKTTAGVYLLAISASLGLHYLINKDYKKVVLVVLYGILSVALIAYYDYSYFHAVNQKYFSPVFMSSGQPITSWQDFVAVWKGIQFWHGQFLTLPASIILTGLFAVWAIKRKKNVRQTNASLFRFLIPISALGLIGFMALMGKQFIDHDYYYITAFTPLVGLLGYVFCFGVITKDFSNKKIILLASVVLSVWSIVLSIMEYSPRMQSHFFWKNRDLINDIEWVRNGDQILDNIGIAEDATVFVGYAAAPNTSLIYLDRKGKVFNHEEMTRDSANMDYWSNRIKPDYYIFPSAWQPNLANDQPKLYSNLVLFAKRPEFYIYKPIQR